MLNDYEFRKFSLPYLRSTCKLWDDVILWPGRDVDSLTRMRHKSVAVYGPRNPPLSIAYWLHSERTVNESTGLHAQRTTFTLGTTITIYYAYTSNNLFVE